MTSHSLAVSAAFVRRMPTSMLCSISHMTGGPEGGGIMGGGGVARILFVHFVFSLHGQYIHAHHEQTVR